MHCLHLDIFKFQNKLALQSQVQLYIDLTIVSDICQVCLETSSYTKVRKLVVTICHLHKLPFTWLVEEARKLTNHYYHVPYEISTFT